MPGLYSLRLVNESPLAGNMCLFQRDPRQEDEDEVFSLAWLSRPCPPGRGLTLKWNLDYGFAWSSTGPLRPGLIFKPEQLIPADPSGAGRPSVTFGQLGSGFCFVDGHNPTAGCLNLNLDSSLPEREVSVALTVDGEPAFARMAGLDMAFTFQPRPEYWITFGPYAQGEDLEAGQVMNGGVKLDLGGPKLSAEAVFQRNCGWALS